VLAVAVLRTLLAVVEKGSFVAAARAVGYSTAQVSRQMNQLQDRVGAQLFVRDGRVLRATNKGILLAEQARAVVRAAEEFDECARRVGATNPPTVPHHLPTLQGSTKAGY